MALRITLEVNEHRQVFTLDELGNSVLDAIRAVVRQEVERVLASRMLPQSTKDPGTKPTRRTFEGKSGPSPGRECAYHRQLHRPERNPCDAHRPPRSGPDAQHRGCSQARRSRNAR
jgi:hypothetical protein